MFVSNFPWISVPQIPLSSLPYDGTPEHGRRFHTNARMWPIWYRQHISIHCSVWPGCILVLQETLSPALMLRMCAMPVLAASSPLGSSLYRKECRVICVQSRAQRVLRRPRSFGQIAHYYNIRVANTHARTCSSICIQFMEQEVSMLF